MPQPGKRTKIGFFFSGLARAEENQGREGDQTPLAAGMMRGAPKPTPNPAAEGQGWLLQKPPPFFSIFLGRVEAEGGPRASIIVLARD